MDIEWKKMNIEAIQLMKFLADKEQQEGCYNGYGVGVHLHAL